MFEVREKVIDLQRKIIINVYLKFSRNRNLDCRTHWWAASLLLHLNLTTEVLRVVNVVYNMHS